MYDSSDSFNGNIKEKLEEEHAFRRKTRHRIIVVTISAILLSIVTVAAAVGILVPQRTSGTQHEVRPAADSADLISNVCNVTLHPDSCVSSITLLARDSNETGELGTIEVFKLSLQVALNDLVSLLYLPRNLLSSGASFGWSYDPLTAQALLDCEALFSDAVAQVEECISSMKATDGSSSIDIDSIRTWLSTGITDQKMCLYGILEARNDSGLPKLLSQAMYNSTVSTSNSLAIASNILSILGDLKTSINRRLHEAGIQESQRRVKNLDQRLLLEEDPEPDIIVAADGSGNFTTITSALDSIPKRSNERTVIYVKNGTYIENVTVGTDHWNVMMYGDGMFETIISGSKNHVDGVPTFSSATFVAAGRGFIAKDMGFKNTAGPEKLQAAAVRASADQSVFCRCYFDAYQDTLYAISGRHFYQNCLITGTIDFIFGDAAAVFQNCSIQPRQPMAGQFNTITANGRSDPNENTGFSFQHCQIKPFDNLTAQTYLGRPWQDYSTTVFMQSNIDRLVNPMGWAPWIPNMDPPSTIFYAEYHNDGPGSALGDRVKWAGFRPNISDKQAEQFTVESLIQGNGWLPKTNVLYDATL